MILLQEDVDEQRKKEKIIALDDLVRNAVARKELNKIIRVNQFLMFGAVSSKV